MEDLIRKSKIYNYIKAQINPFGKPFEGDVYEFGIKLMEYIEQMDAEESVTDTNVGGKWVPCSERLPEKSGTYIVTGMWKGQPREIWMCKLLVLESFGAGWCNDARKPVVDAWMPLPEPYKQEG